MADGDVTIITDIEGLDELEEAFTAGSQRAVKKFLRAVETRAAKVLKTSAEENAPYREGTLSEDIRINTVQTDGALVARVGPTVQTFWGLIQEVGAPEANVPASHWLELSAVEVQDQVLEEFFTGLSEGLEAMKK